MFSQEMKFSIELTDQEVANLKAVLEAASQEISPNIPKNPLNVVNNGAWVASLYDKLNKIPSNGPNMTASELVTVASVFTKIEACKFTHLHYMQAMMHARDLIHKMMSSDSVTPSEIDAVLAQLTDALGPDAARSWTIYATMRAIPSPKSWDQPFETIEGDEIWWVRRHAK